METKMISQENGMATLSVTFTGDELGRTLDSAYQSHTQEENFKLDRQGLDQNPEGMYIVREAVENLLSGCYAQVIKSAGVQVASEPKVTVLKANEQEGVELHLNFALRPELKLGRYKGIQVKMPKVEPTEEELNAAVQAAAAQNVQSVEVDRAAQLGDTTVIDFKGFLDGTAFAGGEGADYPLTLGSGQFIPGFEDQLVGAKAGDQVDVNVTFPENYHAENLKGKAVVFQVTVHKVQEQQTLPLTDEQTRQVKDQLFQQKKAQADQQIEDEVLGIILSESQVELPEAMVESEANICVQQFAAEIAAQSMTIEQFCQRTGKTLDGMRKEMYPLARRRIQLRLVLSAIAKEEGITATAEELEQYWEQMAQQYGLPKDQLKHYMGDGVEEEMAQDLVSQKAYALLRSSTILVQE
jgi:trigger factor